MYTCLTMAFTSGVQASSFNSRLSRMNLEKVSMRSTKTNDSKKTNIYDEIQIIFPNIFWKIIFFLNLYPTCTFNKHYFLNSPQKRTICWLQTIHVSYSSITPFVYAFWGTTFQLTVKWFLPNDLYFYSIKSAGFDSFPAHKGK